MRTWCVVPAVALVLFAAPGHAAGPTAAQKPPPADVGPGRVAWFDLTTNHLARARDFYAKLFAWRFTPLSGTDQAVEIVSGDTPIGTLRVAEGSLSAFNGVVYLQVADLPASCQKVKELGGTIAPGFPFNLVDRPGAIALLLDPTGHPVGLYSRTPLPSKPAK